MITRWLVHPSHKQSISWHLQRKATSNSATSSSLFHLCSLKCLWPRGSCLCSFQLRCRARNWVQHRWRWVHVVWRIPFEACLILRGRIHFQSAPSVDASMFHFRLRLSCLVVADAALRWRLGCRCSCKVCRYLQRDEWNRFRRDPSSASSPLRNRFPTAVCGRCELAVTWQFLVDMDSLACTSSSLPRCCKRSNKVCYCVRRHWLVDDFDPTRKSQRHRGERVSCNRCNVEFLQQHRRWKQSQLFGRFQAISCMCCQQRSKPRGCCRSMEVSCWQCDELRCFRVCTR